MSMNVPPPPPEGSYSGGNSAPAMTNPLVGYWKRVVLENYVQFSGRARRAEYWWFTLANVIVLVALMVLSSITSAFMVLYYLYVLAILVPSLGVSVRRLHDTGKSGWFLLIALIPFIGGIVLLVFMCIDGQRGTNQYGPSEKYPMG